MLLSVHSQTNKFIPKQTMRQSVLMKLITLEEHYSESTRLPYMDSQGITMQVLSYTSPVSDKVPAHEAVKLCAQANDILAEKVSQHPDRFAAFATLGRTVSGDIFTMSFSSSRYLSAHRNLMCPCRFTPR